MDNKTNENEIKKTESTVEKLQDNANEKETRQQKKQERQVKKSQRKNQRATHRIFPIWLRLIVVFVLIVAAVILGLVIGYSVLGDGDPLDVLTFELWERIIHIMTGVE